MCQPPFLLPSLPASQISQVSAQTCQVGLAVPVIWEAHGLTWAWLIAQSRTGFVWLTGVSNQYSSALIRQLLKARSCHRWGRKIENVAAPLCLRGSPWFMGLGDFFFLPTCRVWSQWLLQWQRFIKAPLLTVIEDKWETDPSSRQRTTHGSHRDAKLEGWVHTPSASVLRLHSTVYCLRPSVGLLFVRSFIGSFTTQVIYTWRVSIKPIFPLIARELLKPGDKMRSHTPFSPGGPRSFPEGKGWLSWALKMDRVWSTYHK